MLLQAVFISMKFSVIFLVIFHLSQNVSIVSPTYYFLQTLHLKKEIKHLSSQLRSRFMWKNAPVTVLEKVYVSVTLLETLHLRFLHCPEHIYRSEEYNLALTK